MGGLTITGANRDQTAGRSLRRAPNIKLPAGTTVDVRAACPVLRSYRGTGLLDDPGAWLFTTVAERDHPGPDHR